MKDYTVINYAKQLEEMSLIFYKELNLCPSGFIGISPVYINEFLNTDDNIKTFVGYREYLDFLSYEDRITDARVSEKKRLEASSTKKYSKKWTSFYCSGHGSCRDKINQWKCECHENYEGAFCLFKKVYDKW